MADNNELPANMDLEAILRTLASLPKSEDQQFFQNPQQAHDQPLSFGNAQQYPATHQNIPHHQPADPRLAGRSTPSQLPLPKPQVRSSTPLIDPATIIDWKQGLRCVSKIAASNPDFAASVRKVLKHSTSFRASLLMRFAVDERSGGKRKAMGSWPKPTHRRADS
jgi:hypothetical protein